MATKKITDVEIVTSITDNDSFFINQNGIKQIKKSNIPKCTPDEIGAVSKDNIATIIEMKTYLGL